MSRKLFKNNVQLQTGAPARGAFFPFKPKYIATDLMYIRITLILAV
jgi:hypothetical protein